MRCKPMAFPPAAMRRQATSTAVAASLSLDNQDGRSQQTRPMPRIARTVWRRRTREVGAATNDDPIRREEPSGRRIEPHTGHPLWVRKGASRTSSRSCALRGLWGTPIFPRALGPLSPVEVQEIRAKRANQRRDGHPCDERRAGPRLLPSDSRNVDPAQSRPMPCWSWRSYSA